MVKSFFGWVKSGVLAMLLLMGSGLSPLLAADTPAIAAAANIKFALDEIHRAFTQETGKRVRISYGSSGNFVAQIRHGAPFELFLSADERYIEQLQNLGVTQEAGTLYAIGRLALAAPKSSPLVLDSELNGLKQMLQAGNIKRFAIANPEHAPYGERAKEILLKQGLWQTIEPKLIYGENVSQAAQFALSGSTQGGIVALSLAIAPQFKASAHYVELPESMHSPMLQRMVLTDKAGDTAKQFYHYLQGQRAGEIFVKYGFGLPTHPDGGA